MEKEKLIDLYKSMVRIRKFEEQASEAFAMGDLQGFVHLYIGEEAVATGACAAISKNDYITSTHRGHGHMLAKGADPNRMMAELCGKATGYCRGKGGSMHISSIDLGMLGANGMVGAGFPLAVGAGMAQKIKKTDNVVVCFFGDGSTNEGLFHESLNAASLYKLPVIFVCENNLYGISTRQDRSMAIIDISERANSYNMPGVIVDGNDVLAVNEAVEQAVKRAKAGQGPTLIECKTYKHHGHFEGDPALYRADEEVEEWMAKDPIPRFEKYLVEQNIATENELNTISDKIQDQMLAAVDYAIDAPSLDESEAVKDVYTDIVEEGRSR
ncbi:MAG: thiamine pyrophosphate-dependent dehydrogenase E1 component subunit alpha [Clostridia bacterium]|nr:thiamine pyrophosphate-dependent dehydrogenase E1 component subunit alpha [Clostridia bacterium]